MLVEFTVVPKQETRSKLIELMVADPVEGLHLIKENDNAVYYKDTSLIEEDDSQPFGKVQFIAYDAKRQKLAIYSEAESFGRISVLLADMSRLLDYKDTQ